MIVPQEISRTLNTLGFPYGKHCQQTLNTFVNRLMQLFSFQDGNKVRGLWQNEH